MLLKLSTILGRYISFPRILILFHVLNRKLESFTNIIGKNVRHYWRFRIESSTHLKFGRFIDSEEYHLFGRTVKALDKKQVKNKKKKKKAKNLRFSFY